MIAEILVEIKSQKIDKTFSYAIPKQLSNAIKVGCRVTVPFGKQLLEGFVLKIESKNVDYKLKEIINLVDEEPVLNEEMLKLGEYISKKTYSNLISVYQAMLPKALKSGYKINVPKKFISYIKLNQEIDLSNIKLTPKQLEMISLVSNKIIKKSELNELSSSILKTLIEKNVFEEMKEEQYRLEIDQFLEEKKISLTEEQQNAVNEVLKEKRFNPFLLHGITGSGKTEVYLNIIDECIKEKEAIVLVPEISLTPILINKFRQRFGNKIAVLHSHLSDGERFDEWRKIIRKEVKIVVGARSAIFAPFTNLGLIIIDEEQSDTYKQENNPKYNTIDVAIKRAQNYNCPIILGSATPSIESYTRAKLGIYKLLKLTKRISNTYPKIMLVDMKEEIKKRNTILSSTLEYKLNDCLEKKHQAIILLNRRGYSTTINCPNCGNVEKCLKCEIPYTYHKNNNTMKCHYCGDQKLRINKCSACGNETIKDLGMGTQKLEEFLNLKYKDAKTIRMDVDTTTKKGSHQKIIESFYNKEYDILIGTQMISKGLDFPNVSLVGVINGDASLNIPDYKSGERTFQLLSQVAGRSGRSDILGEVVIQTFNTDHYSINYAKENNYEGFYNEEVDIRKRLKYPPFYDLCLIKLSGKNLEYLLKEGQKICTYLNNNNQTNNYILGPSMSFIPKINNVYFVQIIIKYQKIKTIDENIKYIKNIYKSTSNLKIEIDINPNRI